MIYRRPPTGNGFTNPINQARIDAFAGLLADGLRMCEAQARLGMTKGEAASTMRAIKRELGWQAHG